MAKYSGDGHNHWHVQEMMRYDLWGGGERLRGAKVGFCFLDSDVFSTGLPGYSGGFYTGSMCSTNPNVLSNRMGISIGMGDEYEWFLAWQWVDITGLPAGTYTLRAKVDPYGFFDEEKEGNQCAYARLQISSSGGRPSLARARMRQRLVRVEVCRRHRVDVRERAHHRLRARPLLSEGPGHSRADGDVPASGVRPAVRLAGLLRR